MKSPFENAVQFPEFVFVMTTPQGPLYVECEGVPAIEIMFRKLGGFEIFPVAVARILEWCCAAKAGDWLDHPFGWAFRVGGASGVVVTTEENELPARIRQRAGDKLH